MHSSMGPQSWATVALVQPEKFQDVCPMNQIKVIPYKEKQNYNLVSKYTIGKKVPVEGEWFQHNLTKRGSWRASFFMLKYRIVYMECHDSRDSSEE